MRCFFEGTPVAFFEAKGVDTDLNSDHREQLATYMKTRTSTGDPIKRKAIPVLSTAGD